MAIDPDHFPGVGKLSFLIVAAGKINRAAGLLAAEHAAGIRAVGCNDLAVGQADVGEKSLVALDKRAADQARAKAHRDLI